jgi:4-hydroxybenzoate polyprenyltransferase
MLGVSVVFSCFFLIWENDENDETIDKVSNASRPLAAGHFTQREWGEIKWTFLAIALVSALLAGWYTFIFILFFILLYHAYSCPPLRLKRVPGLSTALIAGNAVVTVMTGFYLGARTEDLSAFPLEVGIGIFIVFLLAENIKNLKDIKGDKAGGIITLPVLLGGRRAPQVVATLAALATLMVPLLFGVSLYSLLLAAAFIPPNSYFLLRKPYSELPVFALYLAYFVAFFLLTITSLA